MHLHCKSVTLLMTGGWGSVSLAQVTSTSTCGAECGHQLCGAWSHSAPELRSPCRVRGSNIQGDSLVTLITELRSPCRMRGTNIQGDSLVKANQGLIYRIAVTL